MSPGYVTQFTLAYKTFLKRAVVESLIASFAGHPDPTVASAKVAIDYTESDFQLPAVIIKYIEQRLPNAGVGHYEWLPSPYDDGTFVEYQHRMYTGSIEFEIFGMSSADRDLVSDALIEVLAMDEVSTPGQSFINRFYNGMEASPYGLWHFPTLNLDIIEGSGEQAMMAPWSPEDQLVYQTAYRVVVFGEFYSYTPPEPTSFGPIEEVDVYAWPTEVDGVTPIDPTTPALPVSSSDYNKYTGYPPGEEDVPTED